MRKSAAPLVFALALAPLALPLAAAEVSEFTLPNGLQAVVIEDHRAPVVVHMVWYRIGSADEAPGQSGVAHFLEHLMFQGSDNLYPGQLSAEVEAMGGSDNAFTSYDYTAYFQRVPAAALPRMMEMEADRMLGLKLTEADVLTERDVILQERAQRTDSDPNSLMGEQMASAQYLNHPYRRPVIGWRHEMEALSREVALTFYKANYAPNNAILVVAGDVSPQDVRALAEKYYGPLAPSEDIRPRQRVSEPPQIAARRVIMADERVSEPVLLRSYLAPERNPGDQKAAAAALLLAELLGGNPTTALLSRKLAFETRVATYAAAGTDGTALDGTSMDISILPAPGTGLAEAEAALDQVLADFLKAKVDPDELSRIKAQLRAADIYGDDSTMGLARRYGAALAVGLSLKDVQEWSATVQAITAEEVMAAAADILVPERSVTGWLMGKEAAE